MRWLKRLFGGEANGDGSCSAPVSVTCQEALERVYEYLDGELDTSASDQVAEHFRVCRQCYPHLRFEQSFLGALQRVEAGVRAPDALRERVLQILVQEGLDPR